MSFGARLSIVCVSDLLVQPESSHLLYAADRHLGVSCSFGKETCPLLSEAVSKILGFFRNYNAICFTGKCHNQSYSKTHAQHFLTRAIQHHSGVDGCDVWCCKVVYRILICHQDLADIVHRINGCFLRGLV